MIFKNCFYSGCRMIINTSENNGSIQEHKIADSLLKKSVEMTLTSALISSEFPRHGLIGANSLFPI